MRPRSGVIPLHVRLSNDVTLKHSGKNMDFMWNPTLLQNSEFSKTWALSRIKVEREGNYLLYVFIGQHQEPSFYHGEEHVRGLHWEQGLRRW